MFILIILSRKEDEGKNTHWLYCPTTTCSEHLIVPMILGIIDFLLTWNCNHLANANKRQHIRIVNTRLNLATPEITTPLELFSETTDDYE